MHVEIHAFLVYGMVYNMAMNNEKTLTAFNRQFNEFYYTPKDLEYGTVAGTFLSPFEYSQLLDGTNG